MEQNVSKTVYLGVLTDFDIDLAASLISASINLKTQSKAVQKVHRNKNNPGVLWQLDGDLITFDLQNRLCDVNGFDNATVAKTTIANSDGTPSFTLDQTVGGHILFPLGTV